MKLPEAGQPVFFLRSNKEGEVLEVLFSLPAIAPFLVPAASLFGVVTNDGQEMLARFLNQVMLTGSSADDLIITLRNTQGLRASIKGHSDGNSVFITGYAAERAPVQATNLYNWAAPAQKSDHNNWLALPQLENEILRLKMLLRVREEMLDSSSDIICSVSSNGTIIDINHASHRSLGFSAAELTGKNLLDIIVQEDRQHVQESVQNALSRYLVAEFRCRVKTRDGDLKDMVWRTSWSSETHLLYAVGTDISAYTVVTGRLKKHKKELKEAQLLARIGDLELDFKAGMISLSPLLAEILGFGNRFQLSLEEYNSFIHPLDFEKIVESARAHKNEKTLKINYRFAHPGEDWRYLTSHSVFQRNENGEIIKIISKVQDITEQHQTEEALRHEKQHSLMIIETSLDAFIGLDEEGTVTDWNCTAENSFCWTKAEVLGKNVRDILLTPDGTPAFDDEVMELMEICKIRQTANARFLRDICNKAAKILKAEISVTCFSHQDQVFLNAFVRDISHQSKADELLRQSERRFKALVQSGADMISLITPDAVYQYVSHNVNKVLGYKPEDLIGKNAVEFFHPDDREMALEGLALLQKEDKITLPAFRFRHANGTWRWMETIVTNLVNDPSVGALVANSRDITEKKRALEESERLATIIEATTDCMGIVDIEGNVLHINSAFTNLLGATLADPKYRLLRNYHPEWALQLIMEQGFPEAEKYGTWTGETAMLSAKGEEILFSQVIISHKNEKGEVEYYSTVARDITGRKELELALRESKERYRSLFDNNPDGAFALDWDGNSMSINKSLAKMLELNAEEMNPEHFTKYVAPNDVEHAIKYFDIAKKAITATFDIQLISKTGRHITVQITTTPIMIEGELVGVFGIAKDITEKYHLDEALRKSNEQLRALTQHIHMVREEERKFIAREIHDELGQQITALKIDISLLANKAKQIKNEALAEDMEKDFQSMMKISDETIQCIRKLVKSLRPIAIEDLGLVSEIKSRLSKFGEMMKMETELEMEVEELPYTGDQALDIFRIFQESLTNIARHADATKVKVSISHPKNNYKIEITDNGTGISDKKLKGSQSFGLLGMRERAYNLKGDLQIKALPKRGTSVILTIPEANNSKKLFKESDKVA